MHATSEQSDNHLCDSAETYRQTGKSPTSQWRGVKNGTFPAPVYLGSKKYWYQKQINEWLAKNLRTEPIYDNLGSSKTKRKKQRKRDVGDPS